VSPTLSPGGVGSIFYSKDGNFDCDTVIGVDANTGKQLWVLHSANKVADAATGSTFIDGSVVVASDSDAVAGVDASTGDTVWTYAFSGTGTHGHGTEVAPAHALVGALFMIPKSAPTSDSRMPGTYLAFKAVSSRTKLVVPPFLSVSVPVNRRVTVWPA
jgi:hypothetical protein